tara:strand:+ start:1555 stop:1908 length:354 start_codon:yes stop_codon:yes gene_type:complete
MNRTLYNPREIKGIALKVLDTGFGLIPTPIEQRYLDGCIESAIRSAKDHTSNKANLNGWARPECSTVCNFLREYYGIDLDDPTTQNLYSYGEETEKKQGFNPFHLYMQRLQARAHHE